MDHPRPFDEPEQIVEEGTPLPRMTRTGDEKVMNDTIGIDISKDHLDTHRLSDGKAKRFTNDRTGLKTLKNWIGPQCCRVVYEPTGRYHRDLEARLSKTAHAMVKVNPKRARRFAEAVGQSAKTDRIDAELLARMGAMLDLKASPLRDEPMNDLREVHVARSALIKDQTACRNRLCGARNTLVKAQLKTRMRQIAKQLAQLDAELKKRICEDAKLARQFEILRSIPGIGPVSAVAIRECPEFCVSVPDHGGFKYSHALKRSSNIIANWLRAANHSRTFLPPFSKLRMAR